MQSKIDYGLSIWGCTTEAKLDRIQRIQNLLTRIMCNNLDYINFHGIEMVCTLRLQTMREKRYYFICILMFTCIHGLAPHYLCNDVTLYIDINGYDTRYAENMDLYSSSCSRDIYKRSFLYKSSSRWCLKESFSIIDFKRYFKLLYGWRLSWLLAPLCGRSIFHMKPHHITSHHMYHTTPYIIDIVNASICYDWYIALHNWFVFHITIQIYHINGIIHIIASWYIIICHGYLILSSVALKVLIQ